MQRKNNWLTMECIYRIYRMGSFVLTGRQREMKGANVVAQNWKLNSPPPAPKKRVAQSLSVHMPHIWPTPDLTWTKMQLSCERSCPQIDAAAPGAGKRHQTLMLIWLHPLKRQSASSGGKCRGVPRQRQRLRNMWAVAGDAKMGPTTHLPHTAGVEIIAL